MTREQLSHLYDVSEKLIGYITLDGEDAPPVPSHGLRRPAWFNPEGPTVSDVNRIGLQMRGRA